MAHVERGRVVDRLVIVALAVTLAFSSSACGSSRPRAADAGSTASSIATKLSSGLGAAGYTVNPLGLVERVAYRQAGGGLGSVTRPLFIRGEPRPVQAFSVQLGATSTSFNIFVFTSTSAARKAVRAGVTQLPYGAFVCGPPACPRAPRRRHAKVAPRVATVGPVVYTGHGPASAFRRLVRIGRSDQ